LNKTRGAIGLGFNLIPLPVGKEGVSQKEKKVKNLIKGRPDVKS